MKNLWFYKFIFVSLFIVTLSGCKIVMEYRMDDCDPTTTIIDSSGTKNDAVLKHGVGNTDGLSAQYSFDSSSDDDYVVCANRWFRGQGYSVSGDPWYYTAQYYTEALDHDDISPLASRSKAMTLTGWFKTSSSNGTIIAKAGGASNSREYRVFLEGGNLKVTLWNQYGSPETFTIASSVADNAWHAFAITAEIYWNNSLEVKKYLDGAYKGNDTRRNFHYCTNTNGSLFIGAMNWGNGNITDYFAGYIDELIMTDDIQSQNALRDSYLNMKGHKNSDGSSRTCECSATHPSPLAEYRFEGCNWTTGATVVDELGNYPGVVVQGAHTAPGSDYGGGLCNVVNLQNEGGDYNRYISLADNPILLSGDWTLMMWVNFPPVFTQHFMSGGYRYSVISGGTNDLAWIRQRNSDGYREWGTSSNPSAHRAAFPSRLMGWHHLTFVAHGSVTDLYVDGVYSNTVNYKQTGTYTRIGTSADDSYIDNNRRQNLDTQMDELKFYDDALSTTEISSIYNLENSGLRWDGSPLNCQLCSAVDHIRIEHPGTGLTCQRSEVTLRACADATCSSEATDPVTVTMTPLSATTTWVSGDTYTFTGNKTVQLRQTTSGTLTLGLTNPSPVPTNGYTCYDSGHTGDCDIDFYDSGFIFDVPDLTSCQSSPNVTFQAVRTNPTTQTCVADGGFANSTKAVNLWSTYVNPATGTNALLFSGTTLATNSPGSGISLNFDANATTNFTVNYPDAGQLQLNARYEGSGDEAGLVMVGTDSFIVRPVGLCVYSDDVNADCLSGNDTCSVFKRVDENFNLKVKGVCWESSGDTDYCSGNATTPNFQLNNISVSHDLVAPSGSGISAGSIGVPSIDIAATDNGEHTWENDFFQY